MKGLLLLILGIFLINSFFSFIPTVAPDVELATYLPYQCWFNILLILSWLLPSNTAGYLLEEEMQPVKKDSSELSSSSEPSAEPSTPSAEPSTPSEPSAPSEPSREPSAPPEQSAEPSAPPEPLGQTSEIIKGGYKSPKVKRRRKRKTLKKNK